MSDSPPQIAFDYGQIGVKSSGLSSSKQGEKIDAETAAVSGRGKRTERSVTWAAWADALGFISELTGEPGLVRRLQGKPLIQPVEWVRRVGGRGGPDKLLPAGTYSDDTQLRIAVGRSITPQGFDINAFAHVELPAWLVYALGGGLATRAGAARLMRPNSSWYSGQREGWISSGGNGAAMRIQPHVWAAPDASRAGPWLQDLLTDACTTHAHPRALLGAALHAFVLGAVITDGVGLAVEDWQDLVSMVASETRAAISSHPELSEYWMHSYNVEARAQDVPSFDEAWSTARAELHEQLKVAALAARNLAETPKNNLLQAQQLYSELIAELQLTDPRRRGSGTATVVAAIALATAFAGQPQAAALVAAREVQTDTDTIATMAAAIAGAAEQADDVPPLPAVSDRAREAGLLEGDDYSDRAYLTAEAYRFASLAAGAQPDSFRYPDLLRWEPPKSQVDLVGSVDGVPTLAGLTQLQPAEVGSSENSSFSWRWYTAEWGQHLLVKTRPELRPLPESLRPAMLRGTGLRRSEQSQNNSEETVPNKRRADRRAAMQPPLGQGPGPGPHGTGNPLTSAELNVLLDWVEFRQYADDAIGYAFRRARGAVDPRSFTTFVESLGRALDKYTRRSNTAYPSGDSTSLDVGQPFIDPVSEIDEPMQ